VDAKVTLREKKKGSGTARLELVGALSDDVQIRLLGYFLHFSEKNIGLLQKSEFIDIVQSRHGQRARHEEDGFTRFVR
tara:strand:+ start:1106 stop:1339 length:234 start_codon:yes stop_codon:yes gene_type:complete